LKDCASSSDIRVSASGEASSIPYGMLKVVSLTGGATKQPEVKGRKYSYTSFLAAFL